MRALLLRVLIPLLFFAFTAPTLAQAAPESAKKAVKKGKKGKKRVSKRRRRLSRRARRRRARRRAAKRAAARRAAKRAAKKGTPKKAAKKKDPRIAQAKAAFKAGRAAFTAKDWGEAIVQYKKAYEITKDGLVMGQVALAFEKAGDFKRALEAIQVYRSALPQSDRASVNEMVARYEKLVGDGKSKHLTLPGETPPPPPKPTVVAKKKPLVDPDKTADKPKKRGRFWTWVALGAAGALAVSALVVGLSAQSKFDEVNDSGCKPNCSDDDVDSIRARAIATDVLWGTALAAGITAGVLFFLEGRGGGSSESKKKDDDLKDLEEESDELVKSFKVTPLVGAGTYGLGADIRF
jgi:tetratricopeptide (TPR) repeat protein